MYTYVDHKSYRLTYLSIESSYVVIKFSCGFESDTSFIPFCLKLKAPISNHALWEGGVMLSVKDDINIINVLASVIGDGKIANLT